MRTPINPAALTLHEYAWFQPDGPQNRKGGFMKMSPDKILRSWIFYRWFINAQTSQEEDDMPAEIDFSHAVRRKFYRPNLELLVPVYSDKEVQDYLSGIASRKGMPISELANDLLKREIQIIEAVKF